MVDVLALGPNWRDLQRTKKEWQSMIPVGFFTMGKSDRPVRSDGNKIQLLRMITEFKCKGYLIFPLLAKL